MALKKSLTGIIEMIEKTIMVFLGKAPFICMALLAISHHAIYPVVYRIAQAGGETAIIEKTENQKDQASSLEEPSSLFLPGQYQFWAEVGLSAGFDVIGTALKIKPSFGLKDNFGYSKSHIGTYAKISGYLKNNLGAQVGVHYATYGNLYSRFEDAFPRYEGSGNLMEIDLKGPLMINMEKGKQDYDFYYLGFRIIRAGYLIEKDNGTSSIKREGDFGFSGLSMMIGAETVKQHRSIPIAFIGGLMMGAVKLTGYRYFSKDFEPLEGDNIGPVIEASIGMRFIFLQKGYIQIVYRLNYTRIKAKPYDGNSSFNGFYLSGGYYF